MEMWRFLTQKFKAQSLEEAQPFQIHQEVEDRDSGTESDEENAELQAIEEAMQSQQRADQENQSGWGQFPAPLQTPVRSSGSPVSSLSKRPLQLVNSQPGIPLHPLSPNTQYTGSRGLLGGPRPDTPPEASSDFERCSLDYEPDSSAEFERHSSEEELAIINCAAVAAIAAGGIRPAGGRGGDLGHAQAEKRKWAQVTRCNSCNDSSGGSSDEEVRDLMLADPKPLNFSASPPKGVQRLSQTLSPTLFLAKLSPCSTVRLCTVSPRKRHRQTLDSCDSTVIQRPCLDFEKMQKTLFRKHIPHGISKTRFVKIRVGLLKGAM